MKIDGQRVLITGASTGIGRELALELGRRGARLAVAARSVDRLETLADEVAKFAARPAVLPTDLMVRGAAAELGQRAIEALGGVDVLVNNAGLGVGGTQVAVADGDAARDVFEVNYWAPLALQRALVPSMIDRGQGAVVNVTSLAQVSTWPGLGHYSSTKAALALATETLRLELIYTPIQVLEVIPGPVRTAIQAETRELPGFAQAMRRMPQGSPDDLARRIADSLERGRKRLVYPRRIAFSYTVPAVVRQLAPKALARYFPPALAAELPDDRVIRSGSRGDEQMRRVREDWETRPGRPATAGGSRPASPG
jgi:short-subunit dehydrogenase